MVSMSSEKPVCAPPRLSEVSPTLALKWFRAEHMLVCDNIGKDKESLRIYNNIRKTTMIEGLNRWRAYSYVFFVGFLFLFFFFPVFFFLSLFFGGWGGGAAGAAGDWGWVGGGGDLFNFFVLFFFFLSQIFCYAKAPSERVYKMTVMYMRLPPPLSPSNTTTTITTTTTTTTTTTPLLPSPLQSVMSSSRPATRLDVTAGTFVRPVRLQSLLSPSLLLHSVLTRITTLGETCKYPPASSVLCYVYRNGFSGFGLSTESRRVCVCMYFFYISMV